MRRSKEHFARELSLSPKLKGNSEPYPNNCLPKVTESVPEKPRTTNHDPAPKSPVKPNRLVDKSDTTLYKPMLIRADPAVVVSRSSRLVIPTTCLIE